MTNFFVWAFAVSAVVSGQEWPTFRGDGDSVTSATDIPLKWNEQAGLAWTTELPGYGQSSPVIWRKRVVVTSAVGDNKEEAVVSCLDLSTGDLLWRKVFKSSQPAKINGYISCAAPSPAIDSDHIYAFFETGNLVALDHAGNVIWQRSITEDHGIFRGNHGLGSSLALTKEAVIVLVCHDGPSYILSLDKLTGKTLWKIDRPQHVSWSSPIFDGMDDRPQIIVSSGGTCEAMDARSGTQLWAVSGIEGNTVPSATITKDLVIVGSRQAGSNLAIRRTGRGDITDTHVAWRTDSASATFNSPLVYRGHVYMVNRAGVAFCLDAESGKTMWKHRIGQSCWASSVGVQGRVYFFGKSGKATVVSADSKLKVLAENELPTQERVYGVAIVNGHLVIRTGSKVICLRDEKSNKGNTKMNTTQAEEADRHEHSYPDLPQAITSFGAAIVGEWLYIYGGHHGKPHHYSQAGQSGKLRRLNLKAPLAWESVATGPKLTGLAMVAHDGMLYRAGGFTARNNDDQDQNLWSVADFTRFDPKTDKWEELPPMPQPRSSFDTCIMGDTLFVVGGWALKGDEKTVWHDTAYSIDLSRKPLRWTALPKPPFQRRALSLGTVNGQIYAIGGMQPNDKVTTETAIYDPIKGSWSEGPRLPGDDMEGFGTACCTVDGRLYTSTMSGKLLYLSDDATLWDTARTLSDGRFFHRMRPLGNAKIVFMGGANMNTGKFASVDVVDVDR